MESRLINQKTQIHNQFLSNAFANISIQEVFILKATKLQNVQLYNNFIQEIISSFDGRTLIQIEDVDNVKDLKNRKRNFVIILVDTFGSFQKAFEKITPNKFQFNGFFMIVSLSELPRVAIQRTFALFWKIMIFNVGLIVNDPSDSGILSLLTFMPFKGGACDNVKIIKINEFDKNKRKWINEIFFPDKFKNLRNCQIRVGTYVSSPGLMLRKVKNVTTMYGFEGDMFNEIARRLNFKLNITEVDNTNGFLYENGTATGIIGRVLKNEFDIIMSLFSSTHLRSVVMTPTKSYYVDRIVLITPANQFLNPFLKLFYVFDVKVWFTLLGFYAFLAILMQVLRTCFPRFNQNNFHEFRTPFLSLLIVIIGGSQHKLPRKNFQRISMGTILVFCLVVRSIYQGGLFNILKKDVIINEIKTIADVNRLRYTFFMGLGIEGKVNDLEHSIEK